MVSSVNEVWVVVPTWRRASWLGRCLDGLARQSFQPAMVLVIGREEDRGARAVCNRWEKGAELPVVWAAVDTPGHIPPVQRGIEIARGDFIVFLDDDAEPREGWLEALLQPFGDARVACVGGRVETPGFAGKVHSDAGQIRWYGKHVGNIGELDESQPIDVAGVMECNWAWRADVLRRLEFDPVFAADDASMYGLDLCLQARALGQRVVYQPGARVVHHVAPRDPLLDRDERPTRTVAYSRNYTYLGLRHFRSFRRIAFVMWWWVIGDCGSYGPMTAALDAVLKGPRKTWPLFRASLRGKWEGTREWWGRR